MEKQFAAEKAILSVKENTAYNGVPVIWQRKQNGSSYAVFGKIHLNACVRRLGQGDAVQTLRHEYGHILQERRLGRLRYLVYIAAPSLLGFLRGKAGSAYYSQPWEHWADILGGVQRGADFYVPGAADRTQAYINRVMRKNYRPKNRL